MLRRFIQHRSLIAGGFILVFVAMVLIYPAEAIRASLRGVSIWWEVLFPSLLPFLVMAELMLGFGVVHFVGCMLDPLMRPLFRIPGIGGFVMTMGFVSGYPVAARLTSQLWEQQLIERDEGERLVSFCTTSDPIFLIGAVSIGFFHNPELTVVLASAHYGTALLVGLLMRFHGDHSTGGSKAASTVASRKGSLISRSFQAMHRARLQDGRPFGQLLQQSIQSAIGLTFVIGGLVVFFSTVLEMFSISGLLELLQLTVSKLLELAGLPGELAYSLVDGVFEVTLGARSAGAAAMTIPLVYKAAAAAFVLAWAGLSVHAQVISLLYRTNLRYGPFLLARLIHSILSAAAVMILWDLLM